jgi:hypothetical protein
MPEYLCRRRKAGNSKLQSLCASTKPAKTFKRNVQRAPSVGLFRKLAQSTYQATIDEQDALIANHLQNITAEKAGRQ